MGANWFKDMSYGKSLKDAYNRAVEDAESYAGHQEGYNGTISTTHTLTDLTPQFKRSGKSLEQYIEMQVDKLYKRQCAAICVQEPVANKNKTKSQVEHIVTPGTKKWVLRYVARTESGNLIGTYITKGHAVNNARKYTEEKQIPTYIRMEKQLEAGTDTVAKITYKKSSTEKPGRWVFFGWAAE